jgi:hypothetical protein
MTIHGWQATLCVCTENSASNAARDRNSSIKAHQINLQTSLIGSEYRLIRGRGQASWVCGRDSGYDFREGQVVLDAPVITLSSLLARGSHRFGEIFPANVCITIFPFCTMKVSEPSSKRLSAVSAFHTM